MSVERNRLSQIDRWINDYWIIGLLEW